MKKTIFIQDKFRDNIEIYEMILAKRGLNVVGTTSESVSKHTLEKASPDILLLNFEFLHRLHRKNKKSEIEKWAENSQKPILLMLEESELDQIKFDNLINVSDLVVKPFVPVTLVEKVEQTLENPMVISKEHLKKLIAKTTKKEGSEKPKSSKKTVNKEKPKTKRKAKSTKAKKTTTKKKTPTKTGASKTTKQEEVTEVTDARTLKSWLVQNISTLIEQNWTTLSSSKKAQRHELLHASLEQIWDYIPLKKIDLGSSKHEANDSNWPSINGSVEVFPVSEIINLIGKQSRTGMLKLQKKNITILVFFQEGDCIFAIGKNLDNEHKLGRFLVKEKSLTRASLDELLKEKAKNPNIPFGYFLVTEGYLKDKRALQRAIALQTKAIFFEILTWKDGQYIFSLRNELPSMATSAGVRLKVKDVIDEGCRRRDEWEYLRAEIGSSSAIYKRKPNTENLVPLNMSEIENRIFREINGINDVKGIVEKVFGHSIEIYRTLHRFNRAGLIEKG